MTLDTGLVPEPRALDKSSDLRDQWRLLTLAATGAALLTSPVTFLWFHRQAGWAWYWALVAALGLVAVFRGVVDVGFRRVIPWPSLFGVEERRLKEEDVLARRRAWFWRRTVGVAFVLAQLITAVFLVQLVAGDHVTWPGTAGAIGHGLWSSATSRALW